MNNDSITYDGLVTQVAKELFPHSEYFRDVENDFLKSPRSSTVHKATQLLKNTAARYLRLCQRWSRPARVVNPRVLDALLSSLPSAIEDDLRLQERARNLEEARNYGGIIEAEDRRKGRRRPFSTTGSSSSNSETGQ
eukprot:GHVN01007561.1.p1 GENE.GHVN01007561.1~~GHVN01007561.1.p1  ORF type:complete len:137 (+),score=4.64 GHVN01007561.1:272-682(+)